MKYVRIRRDAGDMLAGALMEEAGGYGQIIRREGTSWGSATFTGMRHKIEMDFIGAAAMRAGKTLAAGLNEREFELRDHIVADIGIVRQVEKNGALMLEIEALTVEDV